MNQIAPTCIRCGSSMQRLYIRFTYEDENNLRKSCWMAVGWMCRNPSCNHMSQD